MDRMHLLVAFLFALLYINSVQAASCSISSIGTVNTGVSFTVTVTIWSGWQNFDIHSTLSSSDCHYTAYNYPSSTSIVLTFVCVTARTGETLLGNSDSGSAFCTSNAFNIIGPLAGTISGINPHCNGGTGSVTVGASGGYGGYTYTWTPNVGTGTSISGPAGTYSVVISDGSSTVTKTYTLVDPAVLSGTTTQTNVLCHGASTGIAGASPTGGTPPYSYTWSTGANTQSISGLAAATYTVSFTDAYGCLTIGPLSVTIVEPATPVQATLPSQTDVLCRGAATGSASITASGGTSPYTYSWTGSSSTASSASGLTAGTYTVTIHDLNSCTAPQSFTILQPATALSASVQSQTNVLCFGQPGSATVVAAGGTGAYTYAWDQGITSTTDTANSLVAATTYTVTVTDANSCTATQAFPITGPTAPLAITPTQVDVLCFGQSTGSATATVSGGTTPYTLNWQASLGSSVTVSNLPVGSYTVDVTDANNCPASQSYTITGPAAAVTFTPTQQDVLCYGDNTGSASVTAAGGTGTYTYSWTPSVSTSASASNIAAGSYSVVITDSNSCSTPANFVILQPTAALSITPSHTNVNCKGDSTGTFQVTVAGGTPSYTYAWTPSITTTSSAPAVPAGTYSVLITDAHSCTATSSITVTEPATILSVVPSHTDVLCHGAGTGAVSVAASGGTGAYTYAWVPSTIGSLSSASSLSGGTYTSTVTDANGCHVTQSIVVAEPASFAITGSHTSVMCYGGTATVTTTPTGGTGPFTYNWAPAGGQSAVATDVPAGIYTMTATDSCAVTRTQSIIVPQPNQLALVPSQTNVACYGEDSGVALVYASGGTPPYTYSWSPSGGSAATATGLIAGTYTVTVTDTNGCVALQSFAISQPDAIVVTYTQSPVQCYGGKGSATLTVTGGTHRFLYAWEPLVSNGRTATDLVAGTYDVTVTDSNFCPASASVVITQPSATLTLSGSQTNVACYGGTTGSATVTAAGGTPSYTYSWSPSGGTSATASGLSAGSYTVTVTDANGCTQTQSFTIAQPAGALAIAPSQQNVACKGASTGSATAVISGGTSSYTYVWSPASAGSASSASGLSAGSYLLTVTDAHSCTVQNTFTITEPSVALALTATQANALCYGDSTGSASVSVSGGGGAYTYAWTPSSVSTGPSAASLSTGTYAVSVTDSLQCTISNSFTISQPSAPLTLSGSQTNVACYGGTGSATVTASGGTPGYTYSWSPSGGSSATASGISAGSYTVTVTDANGCTQTQSFTIAQPAAALAIAPSQQDVACKGTSTGSATAVVSGGTGSYTYAWSPATAGSAAFAPDLSAGSYSLTVTDANACTVQQTYTITEPEVALALTASQADVLCNGDSTGSAAVSVSGGDSSAYTYAWTPSVSTGASANGLAVGTYAVSVTDSRQCTISQSFTISQPSAIEVIQAYDNVTCKNSATGSASLVVSGGAGEYLYSWSTGDVSENITALGAGDYMVTVSDANQCSQNVSFTISEPIAELAINVRKINVYCIGSSTGTAAVVANGGYPGYTYQWSTGATSASISGLSAGEYSVVVTDSSGCFKTIHFNITEPETEYCQNNGTCTGPNACYCTSSWSGADCSLPVCANGCLNGGNCTAPNNCTCAAGFSGPSCAEADAVTSNQATKVGLGVGLGLGVPAAAAAGVFVFKYAATLKTLIPTGTRA